MTAKASRRGPKLKTLLLAALTLDEERYLRSGLDSTHVRRMVASLRAGVKLPPVLVDAETLELVDGYHRFEAVRRVEGDEAEIAVELTSYGDDATRLLAAVAANASHGAPLDPYDRARACMKAAALGIEPVRLARAMGVQTLDLETLMADRLARGPDGKPVLLKRTLIPAFRNRPRRLTRAQVEVNTALTGMRPEYYLNRTLDLISRDLLDLSDEGIVGTLRDLKAALDQLFDEKKEAAA